MKRTDTTRTHNLGGSKITGDDLNRLFCPGFCPVQWGGAKISCCSSGSNSQLSPLPESTSAYSDAKIAPTQSLGCRHRQLVRILSIPLSTERNRSDFDCRFCPIRQLGSSLYLERFVIVPLCNNWASARDSYRAFRHVGRCHRGASDLTFGCVNRIRESVTRGGRIPCRRKPHPAKCRRSAPPKRAGVLLDGFQPLDGGDGGSALGREFMNWFCFTYDQETELAVTSVELLHAE